MGKISKMTGRPHREHIKRGPFTTVSEHEHDPNDPEGVKFKQDVIARVKARTTGRKAVAPPRAPRYWGV